MSNNAENSASKLFLYSSFLWLVVAGLVGVIVATKFIFPEFLGGIQFLTFGRIRPIHTNGVLFGWLTMAQIGVMLYIVPKLTGTKLYSEKLGVYTAWLFNIVVVLAVLTLALGYTSGVEYAELTLPIDALVAVIALAVAFNVFMTVRQRQEKQLYVTLWYFMASLIWLPLVYIVGNIPSELIGGAPQANNNWFYGHNAIGLFWTPVAVGTMYFLLPKATGLPLYSHKLSLIGFWTIATFYVWNGPHHLTNGPIPIWLMKAGIIPSLLLIIPVWTVVANVFGTLKGNWHLVSENIIVKFLAAASIFYVMACLQGPFQSLMSVSAVVKFTHWVVGHAHMAPFASFSMIVFAFVYYFVPRHYGTELHSTNLANWHFWLSVLGFLIMAMTLWIAGIWQGFEWAKGTSFIQTVQMVKPLVVGRLVGGLMMWSGMVAFVYNIYMTIKAGKTVPQDHSVAKAM